MKKMLLLLAATALLAGSATAQTSTTPLQRPAGARQQPGTDQPTPEQRAAVLAKQLGLSAEQTQQVRQLEESRRQEMQAMRGQLPAGADRAARRQNLEALRTKYDTQLRGILSADQYTQYRQLQENRLEKRGQRQTKLKMKS
ncbi:hypothetical protein KLP40_05845 [Hymenobacter sp. NST-14]|uniref:hypothetical protein n=1 Tax=Hymenobacter piscis TaxID=2839984 RepID=UPI001C02E873|nr:hypothetical protein [Hymenobacter piscis]MBT9392680.1 hypothetical protein [Hymenobacter piscis]